MISLFHLMQITAKTQVELHATISWSEFPGRKFKLMEPWLVETKLYNDSIWLSDHLSFSITTHIKPLQETLSSSWTPV